MRQTPWSRIRGKTAWTLREIVGSAKPTGSVLKETNCTYRHDINKRANRHSRIRLRILSCSRVKEKHREPEVLEEKVPVVECLDGLARITSKELAITHFVKNDTLQNACSTSPRVVVDKGKSALILVEEQPSKKSKKNGDKKCSCCVEE